MSLVSIIASPDPTALALAFTILVATYLTKACFTPPNQPSPSTAKPKDRLSPFTGPGFLSTRSTIVVLFGVAHSIITLIYGSLTTTTTTSLESLPLAICPHPLNLNPHLFTLTPATILPLLAILIFAPIRLACFKHLGKNFTFRLSTPRTLITSGPYKYVQHPSYTCNIIVVLANAFLFERRDGAVGCFLPASIVSGPKTSTFLQVGSWLFGGVGFWLLTMRIRDEEAILKRTFGREWEDYHRRTKRFIPYVF